MPHPLHSTARGIDASHMQQPRSCLRETSTLRLQHGRWVRETSTCTLRPQTQITCPRTPHATGVVRLVCPRVGSCCGFCLDFRHLSSARSLTNEPSEIHSMGNRLSRARAATPPPLTAAGIPVVVGTEAVLIEAATAVPIPEAATAVSRPEATKADGSRGVFSADDKEKAVLPQLDLVFTMDCTGSMGSYIHAAKKNIQAIVVKLVQSEGYDLRFGLIAYRDHPPQDQTYITKTFPFTSDIEQMQRDLATLSAQGGGDGPEAVAAALKETLESEWRPNATKVCVLIADAPPHGLGEPGDGFPDGAPDGVDPFETLVAMSMRGICIYSVGCEPALSNYTYAKDFFVAAAQRTNGQAVSLRSAAALADVIMGGAIEEMDLQKLADEVIEEVRNLRENRRAEKRTARAASADAAEDEGGQLGLSLEGGGMSDDAYDSEEERATAWQTIQSRGHNTRHMKAKKLKGRNAATISKVASLSEARVALSSVALPVAALKSKRSTCSASSGPRLPPGAPRPMPCRGGAASFRSMAGSMARGGSDCYADSDDSENGWDSDGSCEEAEELGRRGGGGGATSGGGTSSVRLETRALSFSQMSRIYGRQRKMGVL